jgi:Trypsin-co-occurring domain 1
MESDSHGTKTIKAQLDDGAVIDIQTSSIGGEEDIAFTLYPFQEVTDKIESIARSLLATFKKVKPQSASVEFGLEVGVESGQLTALLVKGTGTAHLTVTLQWSQIQENNLAIGNENE